MRQSGEFGGSRLHFRLGDGAADLLSNGHDLLSSQKAVSSLWTAASMASRSSLSDDINPASIKASDNSISSTSTDKTIFPALRRWYARASRMALGDLSAATADTLKFPYRQSRTFCKLLG